MKLSEALKILENVIHHGEPCETPEEYQATQLAIECLKWRVNVKDFWAYSGYHRLPNEDDE